LWFMVAVHVFGCMGWPLLSLAGVLHSWYLVITGTTLSSLFSFLPLVPALTFVYSHIPREERGEGRGWAAHIPVCGGYPAGDVAAGWSALSGGCSWVGVLTWILLLFVALVLHVGHMGALPSCGSPLWSVWLVVFGVAIVFIGHCCHWLLSSLAVVVGCHHLLGWLTIAHIPQNEGRGIYCGW